MDFKILFIWFEEERKASEPLREREKEKPSRGRSKMKRTQKLPTLIIVPKQEHQHVINDDCFH